MRLTTALLVFVFLTVAISSSGKDGIFHFPFYGDKPFGTKEKDITIQNLNNLTLEKDGIIFGEGYYAPEIKLDGWDGSQGTVSFWINPIDWDSSSRIAILGSLNSENGWFSFYRNDPEKLYLYGCEILENRMENREIILKFSGLKAWEKNNWYHLVITWKNNSFVKLYINGKIAGQKEGYFATGKKFNGIQWGIGNKKNGTGCAGKTKIRDAYIATYPLSEGEIQLFSQNHPTREMKPSVNEENIIPFTLIENAPVIDGKIGDVEYPSEFTGMIDTALHAQYPEKVKFFTAATSTHIYFAASLSLPEGHKLLSASNIRDDPEQINKGDLLCLFFRDDAELNKKAFSGYYITVAPNGNIYDAYEKIDWGNPFCSRSAGKNLNLEAKSNIIGSNWVIELKIPRQELGLIGKNTFAFSAGFQIGNKIVSVKDHLSWFDHYQAFLLGVFTDLGIKTQFGNLQQGVVTPVSVQPATSVTLLPAE